MKFYLPIFIATTVLLGGCDHGIQVANEEADTILAEANAQAVIILAEAKNESERITEDAKRMMQEQVEREAIFEINLLVDRISEARMELVKTGETELSLQRFGVVDAQYYFSDSGSRTIELTVRNETGQPVSRAYFYGFIKSPFRTVPWAEGEFNYKIPGGVESGEQVTWKFSADYLENWNGVPEDREDLEFNVSTVRVDDQHGLPILDITYAQKDRKELDTLEHRMAELQAVVPNYTPPTAPEPEPRVDPADTPPMTLKPEIIGTVFTADEVYHADKGCKNLKDKTIGATTADSARARRMTPCKLCI